MQQLPAELLTAVLVNLDWRTLCFVKLVCKDWAEVISGSSFWKIITIRDYRFWLEESKSANHFLLDSGIMKEEDYGQSQTLNVNLQNDQHILAKRKQLCPEKAGQLHNAADILQDDRHLKLYVDTKPTHWLDQYRRLLKLPKVNLCGVWKSRYGSHGTEHIQIEQSGFIVRGIKITGDANVPAGVTTFVVRLTEDMLFGQGKIQLAETGYHNPQWGDCFLSEIVGTRRFKIVWKWGVGNANQDTMDFTISTGPQRRRTVSI